MKEVIKALVTARKAIGAAKKGSVNPHFKSKYADLSSVIDAVKEPLEACGLAFVQTIKDSNVVTVILHESGETIELAPFPIVASKNDAQGHGSALTYARRYSLATALGVSADDDDGNAAVKSVAINPVKESLRGVEVDMTKAQLIASLLKGHAADVLAGRETDADGTEIAWKAWELYEPLDQDMKLAVWDVLKTESKTRTWMKTLGDKYRAPNANH